MRLSQAHPRWRREGRGVSLPWGLRFILHAQERDGEGGSERGKGIHLRVIRLRSSEESLDRKQRRLDGEGGGPVGTRRVKDQG